MPSPRRSRYEWQDIITTYRASGMTAAQFAKEHHLNIHTFRYWTHAINIAKDMRKKYNEICRIKMDGADTTTNYGGSTQLGSASYSTSCKL